MRPPLAPLIRPADQERWELLVADMQRRSGEGFLADELGRSAVGASLLRAKLGGRPHRAQQRGGIDCACGYAVDGVMPLKLCPECGDVLLRRWVAEERRLLRAMPAYAEEVARVIEVTAQKQAKVAQSRGDYTADEASATRRAGGRRLSRLRRTHRVELAKLDLRRGRASSRCSPETRAPRFGPPLRRRRSAAPVRRLSLNSRSSRWPT